MGDSVLQFSVLKPTDRNLSSIEEMQSDYCDLALINNNLAELEYKSETDPEQNQIGFMPQDSFLSFISTEFFHSEEILACSGIVEIYIPLSSLETITLNLVDDKVRPYSRPSIASTAFKETLSGKIRVDFDRLQLLIEKKFSFVPTILSDGKEAYIRKIHLKSKETKKGIAGSGVPEVFHTSETSAGRKG